MNTRVKQIYVFYLTRKHEGIRNIQKMDIWCTGCSKAVDPKVWAYHLLNENCRGYGELLWW